MAPIGGPQKGSKIQLCPILTKFDEKYPFMMETNVWVKNINNSPFGACLGAKKGPHKIQL